MTDEVRLVQTEWFVRDMLAIAEEQRVRVSRQINRLAQKGWSACLADGTMTPLRDGILEIRVLGKGLAYRVLCFSAPGNPGRLVVLTACVTKANMKKPRIMDVEIQRAKARRADWYAKEGVE